MRCEVICLCTWWCDDYIDVINKCFRFVNAWFWWWWIICDVLHNANIMRWYIYLDLDKLWWCGLYANFDKRRWCFCVVLFIVESHTLHWRRWAFMPSDEAFMPSDEAFMPSDEAFMPSVPNYGQSDGYHMHNIVVSHGVGYVYVWVVWRWVFNWLTMIELRWCMMLCLVMIFMMNMKWI